MLRQVRRRRVTRWYWAPDGWLHCLRRRWSWRLRRKWWCGACGGRGGWVVDNGLDIPYDLICTACNGGGALR